MNYVKQFSIDGVDVRQVACIELHGHPNAATEGCVGVLGVDVDSPLHEVYKCVAVNGGVYTWELLSSGLSIMSATITGGGASSATFPYVNLLTPSTYVVKTGDLILDSEGYLYQITSLGADSCGATYCGTQVVAFGKSAYDLAVKNGFVGTEKEWLASLEAVVEVTDVFVDVGVSWVEDTANGGYYQTIAVDGILATDKPSVDVVLGDNVAANEVYLRAWSDVTRVTTSDGSITLYANRRAPTSEFTIQVQRAKGGVQKTLSDIETAFDELHSYAQSLVNGGASE